MIDKMWMTWPQYRSFMPGTHAQARTMTGQVQFREAIPVLVADLRNWNGYESLAHKNILPPGSAFAQATKKPAENRSAAKHAAVPVGQPQCCGWQLNP